MKRFERPAGLKLTSFFEAPREDEGPFGLRSPVVDEEDEEEGDEDAEEDEEEERDKFETEAASKPTSTPKARESAPSWDFGLCPPVLQTSVSVASKPAAAAGSTYLSVCADDGPRRLSDLPDVKFARNSTC